MGIAWFPAPSLSLPTHVRAVFPFPSLVFPAGTDTGNASGVSDLLSEQDQRKLIGNSMHVFQIGCFFLLHVAYFSGPQDS